MKVAAFALSLLLVSWPRLARAGVASDRPYPGKDKTVESAKASTENAPNASSAPSPPSGDTNRAIAGASEPQPVDDAHFMALADPRSSYRKTAERGDVASELALAHCYYYGLGGPIDKGKALHWDVRAAEAGSAQGAFSAAQLYFSGAGLQKQSLDLAWIWSSIADLDGLPTDALGKANAEFRKQLESVTPASQRTADESLAAQYQDSIRSGGLVMRPDLTDRTNISIDRSRKFNRIEVSHSCICVPVIINGKGPFRFILDTGAGLSVIDRKLPTTLHLAFLGRRPSTANVDEDENIVEADYSVFKSVVHRGHFIETSFGDVSQAFGMPIDGILGYDFISSCIVEIDYAAKTMSLFDPDAYVHDASLGAEFPIKLWGGRPAVQATLGALHHKPITLWLDIDTGSDGAINLNAEFNREYSFAKLVPSTFPWNGLTLYGPVSEMKGQLPFLTLGTYRIRQPMATCALLGDRSAPTGVIGAEVWKRFKVILDYEHNRIFLEPNGHLN